MPKRNAKLDELCQSLDASSINENFNLEDLTAAFDTTAVTEPTSPHLKRHIGHGCQYHELHLEFPAYDLLPVGIKPHFERPRDMAHREQPHLDFFHIHQADLGCMARLGTQHKRSAYSRAPQYEHSSNFADMINRLSAMPGISTLELICFEHGGVITYEMRLCTTWKMGSGHSTETHRYSYRAHDFAGFMAAVAGVQWADLLDDLINRASDHSYLCVRDRMRKHSEAAAQAEWETFVWNTEPVKSANHVLCAALQFNLKEEVDNKQTHDVVTIRRCGHAMRISREYLFYLMTPDECVTIHCPTCGLRVMDQVARHKASIVGDTAAREAFVSADQYWGQLYSEFNPHTVCEVRKFDLCTALQDTLALLKLPKSAMHYSQDPHNAPETGMLVMELAQHLAIDNDTLVFEPGKTGHLLAKLTTAALRRNVGVDTTIIGRSYVPHGFGKFASRWLKSAVILLTARIEAAKTSELVDYMNIDEDVKDDNKIKPRKSSNAAGQEEGWL